MTASGSKQLDWNDARVFAAVVRQGSFAKAAEELGMAQASVSRRIAAMEAKAGRQLFARTDTGSQPTEFARPLIVPAEQMDGAAQEFGRRLAGIGDGMGGSVRIVAGEGVITYLLSANMPDLMTSFPEIGIEFRTENESYPHAVPDADIYVMPMGPNETFAWGGAALKVRRVGRMTLVPFAAKSFAERVAPCALGELGAQHRLLNHVAYRRDPGLAAWNALVQGVSEDRPRALAQFDTTSALMLATRAGLGISLLPTYVDQIDPLLAPLPVSVPEMNIDLWLGAYESALGSPRTRLVFDFLVDSFRRTPAWCPQELAA